MVFVSEEVHDLRRIIHPQTILHCQEGRSEFTEAQMMSSIHSEMGAV